MLYSNGGMQSAPGVSVYPEGLPAADWFGSGLKVAVGYAGQLDGNGGMRVAHGVTLA